MSRIQWVIKKRHAPSEFNTVLFIYYMYESTRANGTDAKRTVILKANILPLFLLLRKDEYSFECFCLIVYFSTCHYSEVRFILFV